MKTLNFRTGLIVKCLFLLIFIIVNGKVYSQASNGSGDGGAIAATSILQPPPVLHWIYTAPTTLNNHFSCSNTCADNTQGEDWIYSITEVHDQYGGYIASGYSEDAACSCPGTCACYKGVVLRFSPLGVLWWETNFPTITAPSYPVNGPGTLSEIHEFKDMQGPASDNGYHYVASNNNGSMAIDIADEGPSGFQIRHVFYPTTGGNFYFNYKNIGSPLTEPIIGTGGDYGGLNEIIDQAGNNCGYVFCTGAIMDDVAFPTIPSRLALLIRIDSTMTLLNNLSSGWTITPYLRDQGNSNHDCGYGLYANSFNLNGGDLSYARNVIPYWDGTKTNIIFTGWEQTPSNYALNYAHTAVWHGTSNVELTDVYVQEVNLDGTYGTWGYVYPGSGTTNSISYSLTGLTTTTLPVINFKPGTNSTMLGNYNDYNSSSPTWATFYNWGTGLTINNGILYINTECNEVAPIGSTGYIYHDFDFKAFQDIVLKIDPSTGLFIPGTSGSPYGGVYARQFDGIDFMSQITANDSRYAVGSNIIYNLPRVPDASKPRYLGTCFDIVQFDAATDNKQFDQPYFAKAEAYIPTSSTTRLNKGVALNCSFGFAPTDDGGFIFGGTNDINDEDYTVVKLKPGCNGTAISQINNPPMGYTVIPNGTTVSTNLTWSSNMLIQGYVTVRKGGTLNINSPAILKFAEPEETGIETQIVVDTGGTLKVNGATLTSISSCDTSIWDGIVVEGTVGFNQSTNPTYFGKVTFNTGSTISNADTAIEAVKKNVDFSLDLTHAGAIITGTSSNYTDNFCAVKFYPFWNSSTPATNLSKFTLCTFLTDNNITSINGWNLSSTTNPWGSAYFFAWLNGVRGINFIGCNMENTTAWSAANAPDPLPHHGSGIYGYNSAFNVNYYSATQLCNFSGLKYGIYATSIMTSAAALVNVKGYKTNQNTFTDNYADIYFLNINHNVIQNNIFDKDYVGGWQPGAGKYFYGIFLDQCFGYTNWFNIFNVGTNVYKSYGIVASNSGANSNLLHKNTFNGNLASVSPNGMWIAEQAQGTNTKLQLQCNTHTAPIYYGDITQPNPGGTLPTQGTSTTSTGNLLSQTPCGYPPYSIFNNNINPLFTYYYYGTGLEKPFICYNNISITSVGGDANCSISPPAGPIIRPHFPIANDTIVYDTVFVSQLKTQRLAYYQTEDSLQAIIDSGNSVRLYNDFSGVLIPAQLQDSLLNAGPYLSDMILIKAIQYGLPFDTLRNILVPNAPLDNRVLDSLNLAPYTPAELTSIDTLIGVSARTQVQEAANYFNWELGLATNDLTGYFVNDTMLTGVNDSAIAAIQSQPGGITGTDLMNIIGLQVDAGEYPSASASLSLLASTDPYYTNFCTIMPIIMRLKQDTVNGYFALDTDYADLPTVQLIAADTTHPGCGAAKALLENVFNIQYPAYIYPVDDSSAAGGGGAGGGHKPIKPSKNSDNSQLSTLSSQFKIYPNPATNKLNIEYEIAGDVQNPLLTIYTVTGTVVYSYILPTNKTTITENISSFAVGIYFYTISTQNKILQRGKLVITR